MSLTKFVGRIYPNGEFGVACVKEVPRKVFLDQEVVHTDRDDVEWAVALMGLHGIEKAIEVAGINSSSNLGLSMLPNSHRGVFEEPKLPPIPRGQKGITSYGRKLVRNGAYLLERKHQREHLSFLTLTIPSLTVQESVSFCDEWVEIVRVFLQRLTRSLKRAGLSGEVVGCVEIQEERFRSTGVLAPHLHLIFLGRLPHQSWAYRPVDYRTMWMDACVARCPWLAGFDFSACENIQRIKHSCEGYLGKYMSKGAKVVADLPEEMRAVLPRNWYVCTNTLRMRIKDLTWHCQDAGLFLMQVVENQSTAELQYCHPIELETASGRKITVGWYGKLTPMAREIVEVFREGRL